jgi:hypothetical protein
MLASAFCNTPSYDTSCKSATEELSSEEEDEETDASPPRGLEKEQAEKLKVRSPILPNARARFIRTWGKR